MIATAPGKLILAGEYAVLDGATALVIAVKRRAIARRGAPASDARSPFLVAVADELARRRGADAPAVRVARELEVDSTAFFAGAQKLGLGSSAAVTAAATALAIGDVTEPLARPSIDRDEVFAIAAAAHAAAQGTRGARGSGADVAAAVYGGAIAFTSGQIRQLRWPAGIVLMPFFTGTSADTATLVARVAAARTAHPAEVDAALVAIADASRAATRALAAPALIAALGLAGHALDQLAAATGIELVPPCVGLARAALARLGGTAKTTGAGGGDIAIGILPTAADATIATRLLIEIGCLPLQLAVDETGVDLRPSPQ